MKSKLMGNVEFGIDFDEIKMIYFDLKNIEVFNVKWVNVAHVEKRCLQLGCVCEIFVVFSGVFQLFMNFFML